jgi:arabinan endo-1,5-alpha-L-arabinosidase
MKKIFYQTWFVLLGVLLSGAVSAQQIVNPVINHDFPDPTVINVAGKYYGYATNSVVNGKYEHIQLATSSNLGHWDDAGDALPDGATWAGRDFWAPHVLYDSKQRQYVMFFSARSKTKDMDMCIGVAFATKPEGPFIDMGAPLIGGKGYINIDPFAIIDPKSGKKLMYWGSDHVPINVRELSDDWKSFKPGSEPQPVVYPAREKAYSTLVEGPWVDYHRGYYYIYYSGDNCCGPDANYAVMIARAKSPFGPFQRLGEANGTGNSVILEKDENWVAPGHNSIFRDNNGNAYIAYHAIRTSHKGGRVLLISPVVYKKGWPIVITKP